MSHSEEELFEIYSLTGALKLSGHINSKNRSVDLSAITEGVYILQVGNNVVKLIILK